MLRTFTTLIAVVTVAATAFSQLAPLPAEEAITLPALRSHIEFLASDALEGRGVGSRGDVLARKYIETQLKAHGLVGGASDGGFDQPVPIVAIKAEPTTPLTCSGRNGEIVLNAPTDYTAFAGRPIQETSWKDLDIVFVGYGITASEAKWDDFKDVDVKGKVLLVMNNDPSSDPNLFAGKTRLYYGRWTYKYEEAARRGAKGAIIIHTTPSAGYPFQVIQAGQGQEHFHLPFGAGEPLLDIQSWCSEEAAKRMASLGDHDLDQLRAAAEKPDFRPVALGVKASLSTKNTVRELVSGNVLAKIEGSDPILKDEVVVVSAHFDHLGVGTPKNDDAIYNGALDNASGCGALISLAAACARLPKAPARTILFAALTAEESGLLGSLYLARHLPVPAKRVVANYNIDGINIWGPTKDIAMVGYGKNSLTALVAKHAEARSRVLVADPEVDKGLFYRSDHFNFARVGIPCAYFKAGHDFYERQESRREVKNAYTTLYYHTPQDQIDSRWNLEGALLDTRLLLACLIDTAQDPAPPTWTKGDEFEKYR